MTEFQGNHKHFESSAYFLVQLVSNSILGFLKHWAEWRRLKETKKFTQKYTFIDILRRLFGGPVGRNSSTKLSFVGDMWICRENLYWYSRPLSEALPCPDLRKINWESHTFRGPKRTTTTITTATNIYHLFSWGLPPMRFRLSNKTPLLGLLLFPFHSLSWHYNLIYCRNLFLTVLQAPILSVTSNCTSFCIPSRGGVITLWFSPRHANTF